MTPLQQIDREKTTENAPARLRLDYIDSVRALAALFVVLGHAYFEPTNGYYPDRPWLSRLGLSYGSLAVAVFIVVSGFCLMLPIARRGEQLGPVADFFRRRARRILPPYYAALVLSSLFILLVAHEKTGTVWDICLPLDGATFLRHALLVHDIVPPFDRGGINYPLWSIAVECQIYLFMPLIVLSLRRLGNGGTLAWTVALGFAMHIGAGEWLDSARPWYLGLFAFGCVAAREAVAGRITTWWRGAGYALGMVTVGAIVAGGNQRFTLYKPYFDTAVGLTTALLLAATLEDVHRERSLLTRALAWKPLVAVGLFSYSLYLVHAPLLHANYLILRALFHPRPERMFALLVGTIPGIVALAYLFFLLFEKPFLARKRAPTKTPD